MQPTPSPDSPAATPPDSLWAGLRDAIRGTSADYTRIPLRRAVFVLAVIGVADAEIADALVEEPGRHRLFGQFDHRVMHDD